MKIKKIIAPFLGIILGIILCATLLVTTYTKPFIIGSYINIFFPCTQEPLNSFPCFGVYDIAVMLLSVVLVIICTGMLLFRIFKMFRKIETTSKHSS